MDKKTTSVVCYITWIGLLIAFCAGDREGAKFHLNQSLVIVISSLILGVLACIPVIGWIVSVVGEIFLLVCIVMGIISAANDEEKELPLIGKIKILK